MMRRQLFMWLITSGTISQRRPWRKPDRSSLNGLAQLTKVIFPSDTANHIMTMAKLRGNAVYLRLRFLLSFGFLIEDFLLDAYFLVEDFFLSRTFFGRRSSEIGTAGSGADLFNNGNWMGRRCRTGLLRGGRISADSRSSKLPEASVIRVIPAM